MRDVIKEWPVEFVYLPCVPLDNVSIFVSGDELCVQGVPQQRGDLRAGLGNGQVHDGFLCKEIESLRKSISQFVVSKL